MWHLTDSIGSFKLWNLFECFMTLVCNLYFLILLLISIFHLYLHLIDEILSYTWFEWCSSPNESNADCVPFYFIYVSFIFFYIFLLAFPLVILDFVVICKAVWSHFFSVLSDSTSNSDETLKNFSLLICHLSWKLNQLWKIERISDLESQEVSFHMNLCKEWNMPVALLKI